LPASQPPASGAARLGEDPERGMEAFGPRNAEARTWQVIDAVREVAQARGATPAAVSLAWLAARPAVTSVILGARGVEQLAQNLEAAGLALEPEEARRLEEASRPVVPDYPYGPAGIAQRHRRIEGGR